MNRFFKRKHESGLLRLREAITMSRASENLDDLPERFARVISQFETLDVDPRFREDVFQILNGACNVALSMVDLTFPVENANAAISEQLSILSRVLSYLQQRPSSNGFSILLPERRQLVGHFSTREEAEEHLTRYQHLGISRNCLVVPTKVLSLHAIQPTSMPAVTDPIPTHIPAPTPDHTPDPIQPIPPGIAPDTSLNLTPEHDLRLRPSEGPKPSLENSDLLKRLKSVEEDAEQLTRDPR